MKPRSNRQHALWCAALVASIWIQFNEHPLCDVILAICLGVELDWWFWDRISASLRKAQVALGNNVHVVRAEVEAGAETPEIHTWERGPS